MRAWLVLALMAAGCSNKPDCAGAVGGAVDRVAAASHHSNQRVQTAMKRVVTQACVDDQWAPAVVDCVARAADQQALDACNKQLTKEQLDHERKRMDEVLKIAMMPASYSAGSAGSAGSASE